MLHNKFKFMPMLEADGGGGTGGSGAEGGDGGSGSQGAAFDYEKLASIITGKQNVTEDTVLKNYFKQQGISQEDMEKAIQSYKQQKAANTPDVKALQLQTQQAQTAALNAEMEKEAFFMAAEIGVDVKVIPYLMKLADTKEVITENKIDKEKLKASLNKVLEDVPQLKVQTEDTGGFKFGASGGGKEGSASEDQLKNAFGL